MKCPKCNNQNLNKNMVKAKKIILDRCPKCKGIWFDANEIETLLGNKAETNLSVPSYAIQKKKMSCPKCSDFLYEFCYPGTMTLVDTCKSCRGTWLDNNELKEISTARSIKNKMVCPKCSTQQEKSESCTNCGVIFEKLRLNNQSKEAQTNKSNRKKDLDKVIDDESYAKDIPGIKGSLLRFINKAVEKLSDY